MVDDKIKGSIVNVSSHASQFGIPLHAGYCASKGAVDSLTKVMGLELGYYGIRVNTINPTITWTPLAERVWGDPKDQKPMLDRIPLNSFCSLEDVVNTIIYLLTCG